MNVDLDTVVNAMLKLDALEVKEIDGIFRVRRVNAEAPAPADEGAAIGAVMEPGRSGYGRYEPAQRVPAGPYTMTPPRVKPAAATATPSPLPAPAGQQFFVFRTSETKISGTYRREGMNHQRPVFKKLTGERGEACRGERP